ncbi:MAG: lipase maturation factor family protein [Solirubrobacterales bacterium]
MFLRLLGLVYLAAFASLGVQIVGLVGADGIAPVAPGLRALAETAGPARFHALPTLLWLDASDGALRALCWAGAGLAILLICDVAPALCLILLWAAYLSLVTVGQDFLAFQWDSLLLEAGFLAVFVAPWRLRPRLAQPGEAPAVFRWLLWFLLFRLVFSSGLVKLLSGDPAWRGLTALTFHYETQPLPTWPAFYAHHLPEWFHRFSAVVMFAVELIAPFLIPGPRRVRQLGGALMVALQALIALTGNYAYFNLLTVALCLFLFDDAALAPILRRLPLRDPARDVYLPRRPAVAAAALLALLGLVPMVRLLDRRIAALPLLRWASGWTQPFHVANGYGLFAVMTRERPEIAVEGSADGETWRAYGFRFKPGDLGRRPAWVAPHQPRLDWQMWFAALGECRDSPWLYGLFQRLLEGSPPVLGLLADNPFPERPPRYVRAVVYDYRFASPEEHARAGRWWRRGEPRLFCPPVFFE